LKNRQKKQEKQINDICDYRKLTESDFLFLFLLQHFETNVIKIHHETLLYLCLVVSWLT